jgi:hypothetical protein
MGARPGHRGMGTIELGTGGQGHNKLGASFQVPPMHRERRGSGEGVRRSDETDEGKLRGHPAGREERRAQRRGQMHIRASRSEAGYVGV